MSETRGPDRVDVTAWLREWDAGDEQARLVVFELVYDELKRTAAGVFRGERQGHTLQPTAVVHEACLRLMAGQGMGWQNRCHFFGVASRVMRQVLVDHCREKGAQKRGGDHLRVTLPNDLYAEVMDSVQLLALDRALERLETRDETQARIVEARFFGGLSVQETAAFLDLSPTSVKRHWRRARAWLHAELGGTSG